jgi:hypothetical protein
MIAGYLLVSIKQGVLHVHSASKSHLGFTIALVMGIVTAVAATMAVVAKGKRTEPQILDVFDNWEEVLGI